MTKVKNLQLSTSKKCSRQYNQNLSSILFLSRLISSNKLLVLDICWKNAAQPADVIDSICPRFRIFNVVLFANASPNAVTPMSSILVACKSSFSSIEDGLNSDLNSVL